MKYAVVGVLGRSSASVRSVSFFKEWFKRRPDEKSWPIKLVDYKLPAIDVLSKLWLPVVAFKEISIDGSAKKLFGISTIDDVDVELLAFAVRSSNRKLDSTKLDVHLIDASLLGRSALEQCIESIDVSGLFPKQITRLVAKEMLVRTPQGKVPSSVDTVRMSGGLGTVEVILNSAYTGGEMHVKCGGQVTNLKTGPYDWVAVHADASCFISPVTWGARVSLLYDVIPAAYENTALVASGNVHSLYGLPLLGDIKADFIDEHEIIAAVERLIPDLKGHGTLVLNSGLIDSYTLKVLGNSTNLHGIFQSNVDVRASRLEIRRSVSNYKSVNTPDTGHTVEVEREEGYLGSLVIILGSSFGGGRVHLTHSSQTAATIEANSHTWYAFGADTEHNVDPVMYGARVSLHYDIYEPRCAGMVHDPLSGDVAYTQTVTRAAASTTLASQVLAAVQNELLDADAVIITLQYVYPDSVQPEALRGGDKALYNILSDSAEYDVQFVKLTLPSHYDSALNKAVLKDCTYTLLSSSSFSEHTHMAAPNSITKLLVLTKLTEKHRSSVNMTGPYYVHGLRISKRLQRDI